MELCYLSLHTIHSFSYLILGTGQGFEPCGAIVEIMNEDGSMARLPELLEISKKFDLKIVSIEQLIAYRLQKESIIIRETEVHMPTTFGDFKMVAYKVSTTGQDQLALVKGDWKKTNPFW